MFKLIEFQIDLKSSKWCNVFINVYMCDIFSNLNKPNAYNQDFSAADIPLKGLLPTLYLYFVAL